jgi:hypothetical protein
MKKPLAKTRVWADDSIANSRAMLIVLKSKEKLHAQEFSGPRISGILSFARSSAIAHK